MKRLVAVRGTFAVLFLAMLGLGAIGRGQEGAPAADVSGLPEHPTVGSYLFVSKGCVHCHAIQGQGGTEAPDLGKIRFSRSLLEMGGILWNHSPRMSRQFEAAHVTRPSFTVQEMSDLMVFLYFLNYFDEPGNPEEGKALFAEKQCIQCHSIEGEPGGGQIGPMLGTYAKYPSPLFFITGMWNHGRAMTGVMATKQIEVPQLRRGEIVHLLAYIRSVGQDKVTERVLLRPGSPRQGRMLFQDKGCALCHPDRSGVEGIGPNVKTNVRGTLAQIAGDMWSHGPQMWRKMAEGGIQSPALTVEEMSDLVSYLYFLQYFDEPGNAARGGRLFDEKGCSVCHSLAGTGGKYAPDLSRSAAFDSPIHAVTAFWNHLPAMEALVREREMTWPTFETGEMADLVEFIRSKRQTKTP
jgi:mono/diheme cytochrome c family protein